MPSERKTLLELIGQDEINRIAAESIEVLDHEPGPADIWDHTRRLPPTGGYSSEWEYICNHFFVWDVKLYCRECGCEVLAAWVVPHYRSHTSHFSF